MDARPGPAVSTGLPDLLVHHDGKVMEQVDATLPVRGNAVRWGLVVFEGVRVYRTYDGVTRPWLLGPHLDRLRASCLATGLDPSVCDRVAAAIDELLAASRLAEDCYLLLTVSAGNPVGTAVPYRSVLTVSIAATGHERWLATGEGMALTVRSLSDPAAPEAVVLPFARRQMLLARARSEGFDDCAIVDADGSVTRTTSAALFLVEAGALVVPAAAGAPGIMGSWLTATAPELGIEARTEPVDAARLRRAAEVFTCGTGVEFGCVRSIDGTEVADWPRFPVTTALSDEMFRRARSETAPDPGNTGPRSTVGECRRALSEEVDRDTPAAVAEAVVPDLVSGPPPPLSEEYRCSIRHHQ